MKIDYARKYANRNQEPSSPPPVSELQGRCDCWLLRCTVLLISLGIVMVASSSMPVAEKQMNDAFYFINRHLLFLSIGLVLCYWVYKMPIMNWYRYSPLTLLLLFVLLVLVLIPGLGKSVNGSFRWIALGSYNLQVSELAKLFVLAYIASYLVRHPQESNSSWAGFIKPMSVVLIICALLLAEPDFGTSVILIITSMILMYLGGVRGSLFFAVMVFMMVAFLLLAYTVPYRFERLMSFQDPWSDPLRGGYQLVNSLMAFGLGGFFGVGLGAGMQKAGYLPEPHTDFLFAVIGEELGLIGSTLVILLFLILATRAFAIANQAVYRKFYFHAYFAYGIGTWICLQAFTNIGVNLGVLPTKGLTLPLMSYGGSSLITTMIGLAILFRIDYELRFKTESLQKSQKATRRVY